MIPIQLSDVLAACDGRLARDGACGELRRVSTDSRSLQEGDLFVALSGPNHDGNDVEIGRAHV